MVLSVLYTLSTTSVENSLLGVLVRPLKNWKLITDLYWLWLSGPKGFFCSKISSFLRCKKQVLRESAVWGDQLTSIISSDCNNNPSNKTWEFYFYSELSSLEWFRQYDLYEWYEQYLLQLKNQWWYRSRKCLGLIYQDSCC